MAHRAADDKLRHKINDVTGNEDWNEKKKDMKPRKLIVIVFHLLHSQNTKPNFVYCYNNYVTSILLLSSYIPKINFFSEYPTMRVHIITLLINESFISC